MKPIGIAINAATAMRLICRRPRLQSILPMVRSAAFSSSATDTCNSTDDSYMTKFRKRGGDILPGIMLSGCVMMAGFEVAEHLGQLLLQSQGVSGASPISGIPVSILIGIALNNIPGVTLSKIIQPGLKFCTTTVLRSGIVCVGAKLSAVEIVSLGIVGVPVVMTSIAVTMAVTARLGRAMQLSPNMTSLIAAGSSICGVTAITAVAPAIKANQQEISIAVANVVAFGTLGMLCYPYLLPLVLTSSQQIGTVMGLAIHDTSQVMGAALTYQSIHADEMVLKAAAVTKLTRNLFLAGVIPYLSMKRRKEEQNEITGNAAAAAISSPSNVTFLQKVQELVPLFVFGFVGMSAVRSVGDAMLAQQLLALGVFDAVLWKNVCSYLGNDIGGHYLLGTAMAAVGLNTSLSAFKGVGVKPFIVGFSGASCTAVTALGAVAALGHFGLM